MLCRTKAHEAGVMRIVGLKMDRVEPANGAANAVQARCGLDRAVDIERHHKPVARAGPSPGREAR